MTGIMLLENVPFTVFGSPPGKPLGTHRYGSSEAPQEPRRERAHRMHPDAVAHGALRALPGTQSHEDPATSDRFKSFERVWQLSKVRCVGFKSTSAIT